MVGGLIVASFERDVCWVCDGEGFTGPFFNDCPRCKGTGVIEIEDEGEQENAKN